MLTSNWSFVITNIGCFKGTHTFILRSGLNILASPNATGKSSFIKALKLLIYDNNNKEVAYHLLNNSSLSGSVILKNKENYYVNLKRSEDEKVLVDSSNSKFLFQDSNICKIAFLTEDNPFMLNLKRSINNEIIYNWLSSIADLQYYKKAYSINSSIGSDYECRLEKILSEVKVKESSLNILIDDYRQEKAELEKRLVNIRVKSGSSDDIEHFREKHTKIAREIELLKNRLKNDTSRLERAKFDVALIQDKIIELGKALNEINNQFECAELEIKKKENAISRIEIQIDKKEQFILNKKNNLSRFKTIRSEIENLLINNLSKCSFCNSNIDKGSLKDYLKQIELKSKNLAREIEKINFEINQLSLEKRVISSEIQDFKISLPNKKRQLEKRLRELEKQLSNLKSIIETYPEKIIEENKTLQDKVSEYNKIQQILIDITSTDDRSRKIQNELVAKIDELERKIADAEHQLYKMKSSNQQINNLNILLDGIKQISNYLQEKIIFFQDELIDKINERIKECFIDLQFLDFSSIFLTDELTLEIKRKSGVFASFNELSTMERSAIAIIVAFSALKALYPKFPIFAIDDPLNAADDLRFQRLVQYLSTKIPLLIVTRNVAKDESDLKILSQENILVEI